LKPGLNRLLVSGASAYLFFWALVSFYPSPVDSVGFIPNLMANILNFTGHLGLSNFINYSFLEAFANVLFYLPLGLLLGLSLYRLPYWQLLYFAFAISLGAETMQGLFISRRVSSWLDVWHNLVGAILGLLLAQVTGVARQRN
jgi:glycopeptide antibiotics resistance protein